MQNDMPMTIRSPTPKSKPEIEFQYGDRPFSKPEVVLSQPWIEVYHRNLAWK